MNLPTPQRPHFRRPPILEQAISLNFERLPEFDSVDFGLFWHEIRDQFPRADTAPRTAAPVESFEGIETSMMLSLVQPLQLPRSLFRNDANGELVQVQDDSFGFNWIKASDGSQYPRFEQTSGRLWELYGLFTSYLQKRHNRSPALRQCELTNVNLIPVSDFGEDFSDMGSAFVIDPFAWGVPGLVAETYVRRRQHRIVDESGKAVGRLHSVISPVYDQRNAKQFQFEITARSAPTIRTDEQAVAFFDRAHSMINGVFVASATKSMRALWGEFDGE